MNTIKPLYSGILLAGGKSTRMGEDKAFMIYKNRFLYEHSLSVLSVFSEDILISSSNPRFEKSDYRLIPDETSGLGPLGGIYSCLKKIKYNYAIVLPCDLPLISGAIIEKLITASENSEITIALNHNNLPEPLVGIYSISAIPAMQEMIESNQFKMQELFTRVKTRFVKIPRTSKNTFHNINSPDDFNALPANIAK